MNVWEKLSMDSHSEDETKEERIKRLENVLEVTTEMCGDLNELWFDAELIFIKVGDGKVDLDERIHNEVMEPLEAVQDDLDKIRKDTIKELRKLRRVSREEFNPWNN